MAFIDIGLPGFDAYEVARQIRVSVATRTTRLIAITGYGQREDRQRALDAGFDSFLVKPVALDELVSAIAATRVPKRAGPRH